MAKGIDRLRVPLAEVVVFTAVLLLLSAGTYSRNRLWNDEIALMKDCLEKSSNKPRVHLNLGSAYLQAGDYGKALGAIKRAIEIDSDYAEAYYNLSIASQKMGDLDQAIAMARKSLELDPKLYTAYYTLGTIYFEKGQYAEAEGAFKAFVKVLPFFPEAHHLLAVVYAAQKEFVKAVAEFEWELRINPYHILSHLNLGQILWFEMGNRKKAIYHLKVALMLDPLLPNRGEIRRLVRTLESS